MSGSVPVTWNTRPVGRAVIAVGALAVLAAVIGSLSRLPDAPSRTAAFLDQYISAIPWGVVLITAPVLLLGFLAAARRPVLVVFSLAALLPLNLVGMPGESRILVFSKVLVNLLFVLSLVTVVLAPAEWRAWLRTSGLGWWLSVFCGWLAFSAIQGYFSGYSLYEWMREFGWLAFWSFGIPVGMFVRDRRQLRALLVILIVAALVSEVLALRLLITGQRYERPEDWVGGGTFLRAPFSEGMRFVLLWAVAGWFALRGPARTAWVSAGLGALAMTLGLGLLASLGRSLWLTSFAGVAAILALAPRDGQTGKAVFLALAGAVAAAAGIELLDRLSPYSSGQWLSDAFRFAMGLVRGESVSSTVGRQVEWQNAIHLWLESPFVGNGIGAPYTYTTYNNPDLASFYTHNSYLNVLAKTGLVGFAIVGALLLSAFRLVQSVRRARWASSGDRVLALAMTSYLVAVLVQSAATPTITTTDSVMFFSFVLGLSVAQARIILAQEVPGRPEAHIGDCVLEIRADRPPPGAEA